MTRWHERLTRDGGEGARNCLFAAALVATVVLAYQPAWHAGLIWDDALNITRPKMQSWNGLYRIWFDPGATTQYYPLLHSVFWLQHKLWGDATLGYHLVNILLHAAAALLVALVLRRLAIPGAYLAAAIFALHPVQVESVAWITELKNTLSTVLYLGAALTYLRFDRTRKAPWYLAAAALFVLSLLSKTVTVTLPAALLVLLWWQRGRLSWRRDVLPLAPLFVLAAVSGLFTVWVERTFCGAQGPAFEMAFLERCLLAGRALWFYLGKLFWPAPLLLVYPRWTVSRTLWWQYLFPAALLLLLAVAWRLRRRWRGPLAGLLFFAGTLFPLLGFFNAYLFIYTYVADHFQYLASLGIITLVSAGIALLLDRWRLWGRPAGYALCLALLATLAGLTWRQSRLYAAGELLYRATIDGNPGCWVAYNNLGVDLGESGRADEAIASFRRALEIQPDYAEAHNNLGTELNGLGRVDEAIVQYRKAVEIKPDYADAHNNLGNRLDDRGQSDEAIAHYRRALEIQPENAVIHFNLGLALAKRGLNVEAVAQFRQTLEYQPGRADAHYNLGLALEKSGRVDQAIVQFRKTLEIQPDSADAHYNLGLALEKRGLSDEAVVQFRKTLEIQPDNPYARLALALAQTALQKRRTQAGR